MLLHRKQAGGLSPWKTRDEGAQAGDCLVAEKLVGQLVTDLDQLFLSPQRKFKESLIFVYFIFFVSITII
jgi:hypothetical protein